MNEEDQKPYRFQFSKYELKIIRDALVRDRIASITRERIAIDDHLIREIDIALANK